MDSKKLPIGVVIKDIIKERNLRPNDIAAKLKISRQNIYLIYSRMDMPDVEVKRWASVLGTTAEEIYKRRSVTIPEPQSQDAGSEYLIKHLATLEAQFKNLDEQFKRVVNQLEIKDGQIASLQELLKMSLGKPDLGGNTPCAKVLPMPVEEEREEEQEAA